jgi:hypothetical protein
MGYPTQCGRCGATHPITEACNSNATQSGWESHFSRPPADTPVSEDIGTPNRLACLLGGLTLPPKAPIAVAARNDSVSLKGNSESGAEAPEKIRGMTEEVHAFLWAARDHCQDPLDEEKKAQMYRAYKNLVRDNYVKGLLSRP